MSIHQISDVHNVIFFRYC